MIYPQKGSLFFVCIDVYNALWQVEEKGYLNPMPAKYSFPQWHYLCLSLVNQIFRKARNRCWIDFIDVKLKQVSHFVGAFMVVQLIFSSTLYMPHK